MNPAAAMKVAKTTATSGPALGPAMERSSFALASSWTGADATAAMGIAMAAGPGTAQTRGRQEGRTVL